MFLESDAILVKGAFEFWLGLIRAMSFKENAVVVEKVAVTVGFFGALLHIILWFVPVVISPGLTGTGLARAVLPFFMHVAAVVIILAGLVEFSQMRNRPMAIEKCQMITGAMMSIVAGAIHFVLVPDSALGWQALAWSVYVGTFLAIAGALVAACAIVQWD